MLVGVAGESTSYDQRRQGSTMREGGCRGNRQVQVQHGWRVRSRRQKQQVLTTLVRLIVVYPPLTAVFG